VCLGGKSNRANIQAAEYVLILFGQSSDKHLTKPLYASDAEGCRGA
jgi:hypothetical protein